MNTKGFYHEATGTLTYVVWDPATKDAVIIDPVLDFDPVMVSVSEGFLRQIISFVRANDLKVHYALDTHAHADHMSGFQLLKKELGAKIGIGWKVTDVQAVFKDIFQFGEDFKTDGSQWDVLVHNGEELQAGSLVVKGIHSPGHTPACMSYEIGGQLYVGDVIFMPDFGTGRCDFPGGSAENLYRSIQHLYTYPDDTKVFVGHDYMPGGRELEFETTIGTCKAENKHVKKDTTLEEFVKYRTERDATLKPPRLIFQSLQVNARAGVLPAKEGNFRYLKIPMNVFG